MLNVVGDALENTTTKMTSLRNIFSVEILYKPSITENITNLRFFDDDEQILHFMANIDVFKDASINEDVNEQSIQDTTDDSKGNLIPKSVVSLKKLYDLLNHFKELRNTKTHSSTLIHKHINLGTEGPTW